MTTSVTTEFRAEFESERERWLRRRFLWYTGVVIGMNGLALLSGLLVMNFVPSVGGEIPGGWANFLLSVALTLLYIGAFAFARRTLMSRERMLRLVSSLILIYGVATIIATPFIVTYEIEKQAVRVAARRAEREAAPESASGAEPGSPGEGSPGAADAVSPAPREERVTVRTGGGLQLAVDDEEGLLLDPSRRERMIARAVVLNNSLAAIFFLHFFACLFLPWSPRESIRPIVPLLVLNAIVALFYIRLVPLGGTISILASPLVAVPGALICWWRQSRFKDRFHFRMLKGRYGEMKQELGYARKIHESLFPAPLRQGAVQFEYRYEPMRQIGGDYLYARSVLLPGRKLPALNLVIIDVTGHGIGAALTVNRLHGEIDRQFGEDPEAGPGRVLKGLNDYLHHSLASHSVYATALCLRVDPNDGRLAWASAGHPPAFLRGIDGTLDRLESTTLVLGACRGADFEANEQTVRFVSGDVLIAYTDGAIECRNAAGRLLGVTGLQRIVAGARPDQDGGWASAVIRAVDDYRHGPAKDDTLLVEVFRPVKL